VRSAAIRLDLETIEVFAWVGVALAWAQALERTLAAYLILARPAASTSTREEFRNSIQDLNSKTLSVLVKGLRANLSADEVALVDGLGDVTDRRNYIAHHFFRKPSRRALLHTAEGRASMILEAQRDMTDFRVWAGRLAPFVLKHAVRLGNRSEHLREHAEWLDSVAEDFGEDDLRAEARVAVTLDPSLPLQIAELMEEIERQSSESSDS
jgi:hypothetical protein